MRTKTLCQAHLSPSEWASTSPGNRHRPICWQRHHGRNLTLAPGAEAHFHPPENIGSITIHAGCLHVLYIQLNMKSKLNRWTENIIHDQRKASPGRMIWVLYISKVRCSSSMINTPLGIANIVCVEEWVYILEWFRWVSVYNQSTSPTQSSGGGFTWS